MTSWVSPVVTVLVVTAFMWCCSYAEVFGGRGGSGEWPAFPSPPLFWLLAKLAELCPCRPVYPLGQEPENLRRK